MTAWEPDAVAFALYAAWLNARDAANAHELLATQPVPGPVALRARFHFLADAAATSVRRNGDLAVSRDDWLSKIGLEMCGDEAIRANDTDAARSAFSALQGPSDTLHERLANIHGLIGLADAARQIDELDEALPLYERAIESSQVIHHRFGQVRALVPLAYLTLTIASATEAEELFSKAEEIAASLDERLYLANALIGRGECLQRRRQFAEGREVLRRALEIAEQLRSRVAIGNAAQRLADLELRAGRRDKALPLLQRASEAYESSGVSIGAATTADSLADLLIAAGRPEEAMAQYRRARHLSHNASYERGEAHALTGIGQCEESVGSFDAAADAHREALSIYERLDDLVGRTSAQAGLARASAGLADHAAAVRNWLRALEGVEEMRSLRERTDLQDEYRLRFAEAYAGAMRTSVHASDAAAFVAVFESLAGRRLAGLFAQGSLGTERAELLSQLVARADQRLLRSGPEASREERLRRLSAAIIRFGTREEAQSAADSLLAAAQRPIDLDKAADVLAKRPTDTETLLLAPMPDRKNEIAWLWRSFEGEVLLGLNELSLAVAELLTSLARDGLADRRPTDLKPLTVLIPAPLRERLATGDRTLLLVAIDELWSVPFAALPLPCGRLLGESAPLLLSPSLSLNAALSEIEREPQRLPRYAKIWRSPAVAQHDLEPVFVDDPSWEATILGEAWQAGEALTKAEDHALVVVVCHGRPESHIGHYLELEPGTPLTPAELLDATRTPEELVIISCWGAATPSGRTGDPLTVATLALTRGSRLVAATLHELGDSHTATIFTRAFIHRLRNRSMPVALRDATAHVLSDPTIRHGALRHWAPLAIFGSL